MQTGAELWGRFGVYSVGLGFRDKSIRGLGGVAGKKLTLTYKNVCVYIYIN